MNLIKAKPANLFLLILIFLFPQGKLFAQLKGTYTIDALKPASAANYVSLSDAASDLMTGKRSSGAANGPGVNGRVIFNIANGSYGTFKLGNVKGTSQANRIVFQSATGDSSKVVFTSHVLLDTASFITLKQLTIAPYSDTVCVNIRHSHNDSLINNIIRQGVNTGKTTYGLKSSLSSYNNIFVNNKVTKGNYGVYADNPKAHSAGLGLINNTIDSCNQAVWLSGEDKFVIEKNKILQGSLILSSCDSNWRVRNNILAIWGIYQCTAAVGSPAMIYNNMCGSFTVSGCQGVTICSNTSVFSGLSSSYGVIVSSVNKNVNITDNIIYGTGGIHLYKIDTTSKGCTIDYNMYYSDYGAFAAYGLSFYQDYGFTSEKWVKKTGFDQHSQFRNPRFRSLKGREYVATNPFLKSGTPVSQVTDDYYGITRNTLHPTIGAAEIHADSCLNGNYTIGGSGADFASFNAAVHALDRYGVCGKVIFKVRNGTYTEHLHVPAIFGTSAYNKVIFTSETGDSSKVWLAVDSAKYNTVYIDSSSYITFSRMTMISQNSGAIKKRYGTHDSISHVVLLGRYLNTNEPAVNFINNNDTGSIVCNSWLHDGGFKAQADSTAPAIGTRFINNMIDSTMTGIYLTGQHAASIQNNSLYTPIISYVSKITEGIYISNCTGYLEISGNRIKSFGTGMELYRCFGDKTRPSLIANNIIYANNTFFPYIDIQTCSAINIYYNTIQGQLYLHNNTSGAGFNIVNNIIGSYSAQSNTVSTLDYNNYPNLGKSVLALQLFGGTDPHSIAVNPAFDATESYMPHYFAIRMGKPLPGLGKDFYGNTRNAIRSTIGAVELPYEGTCMSGTYTIGGSKADYSSFNAAANDLLLRGVCGPVTFNVADGTYNERLTIHPCPGLSLYSRVIFQSASGDSSKVILTDVNLPYNKALKTLALDSASFITFKRITVSSNDTIAVHLYQSSCDSISGSLILQNGSGKFYNVYCEGGDSGNVIHGNHIIGGFTGVGENGYNPPISGSVYLYYYNDRGFRLTNNTFDSVRNIAINISSPDDAMISGNKIGAAHMSNITGISLQTMQGKWALTKNEINTKSIALQVTGCSAGLVANNMMSSNSPAISASGNNGIRYLNNNILCNSNALILYQGETHAVIKNNIFSTTATGSPLYIYDKSVMDSLDFNNYYPQAKNIALLRNSSAADSIKDLASMKTTFGKDANSVSEDPQFISSINLHIKDSALAGKASPEALITDDFDGRIRPFKPTIGAHELHPINDFSVKIVNPCLPSALVHFTVSKVNSSITSYLWDFNDGKGFVPAADTVSHIYKTSGAYTISVKMLNGSGTQLGMASHSFTIYPLPKAYFGVDTAYCINSAASFTDSSASATGPLKYSWKFGDGWTDAVQNPNHTYKSSGTYNPTLTVTDMYGCSNTASKPVHIHALPKIAWHAPASVCAGTTITFTDSTHLLNNESLSYAWDFGDGQSSNAASPVHSFNIAAVYKVSQTAVSALGCSSSLQKTIAVNSVPKTAFYTTGAICQGSAVDFKDSSHLINTGTLTYSWKFGDGDSSSIQNPSHIYKSANTYKVNLNITNSNGCTQALTKNILIHGLPSALFSDSAQKRTLYFFPANTSYNSYAWDLGDGATSDTMKTTHTYAKDSTYKVLLLVTDGYGCQNRDSLSVAVSGGTGISLNDLPFDELNIYPNPSSSVFVIQYKTGMNDRLNIRIENLQGQTLLQMPDEPGAGRIIFNPSAAHLSAGIYFVSLYNTSGMVKKKIVYIR